jgi:hypothetical protein
LYQTEEDDIKIEHRKWQKKSNIFGTSEYRYTPIHSIPST